MFSYAEFCFFCNEWHYDPEAWVRHCREHLEQDHIPMELSWERVETTFLPGHCPFCLWDQGLDCAKRLQPFCSLSDWEAHITDHGISWQSRCPDPRCEEVFHDKNSFQNHMHDLHHVPKTLFLPIKTALKRGPDGFLLEGSAAKKSRVEDDLRFEFHYCNPRHQVSTC